MYVHIRLYIQCRKYTRDLVARARVRFLEKLEPQKSALTLCFSHRDIYSILFHDTECRFVSPCSNGSSVICLFNRWMIFATHDLIPERYRKHDGESRLRARGNITVYMSWCGGAMVRGVEQSTTGRTSQSKVLLSRKGHREYTVSPLLLGGVSHLLLSRSPSPTPRDPQVAASVRQEHSRLSV